jgi:hypothetical protein
MLNFVSHFPVNRQWSLLFHARGYGISHMMPLSVALEMGKLVQQDHFERLQRVYIVQGSWFMEFLLRCIFPFLRKEMREKFVLINGSLLEVMTSLNANGLSYQALEELRSRFG